MKEREAAAEALERDISKAQENRAGQTGGGFFSGNSMWKLLGGEKRCRKKNM